MPYLNPAQRKAYLAKYRDRQKSEREKKAESERKGNWYKANREREKAKREARNHQDRRLLNKPIPVVFPDGRSHRGHLVKNLYWEEMTPNQVLQCFTRDENGVLHLRGEKQQLQWLRGKTPTRDKLYSVIRGKIWFNRDAILTIDELKELANRLN